MMVSPGGDTTARLIVARALDIDRMTGEVVIALREAGVRSVLLKGPTLAAWLYRNGMPRGYVDSDVLVAPSDMQTAERALTDLGFKEVSVDAPHARAWARRTEQLDLHFTLPGISLPPADAWREISRLTEPMSVGGVDVEALAVPLRALLVALHAAHHGPEVEKPLVDLRLAIERAPEHVWREATILAYRLGGAAPFSIGLRLVPEGVELARRIGLPSAELIASVTELGSRAPIALGLQRLVEARGMRAKLALIGREVVPTRDFMRWWSPVARRGPLGLAISYPLRILWLIRHAVPSFRVWRSHRPAGA
jgi:hypothetical protein